MATAVDIAVIRRRAPRVPGDVRAIRAAAAAAIGAVRPLPLAPRVELAVVLAGDAFVRRLNRRFRGIDHATNVLAFPAMVEEPHGHPAAALPLGDVVLSAERIAAEAADQGKTYLSHLSHLIVHGVLHLLGYDHVEPKAARAMERIEIAVLAGLSIADPYRSAESPKRRKGR